MEGLDALLKVNKDGKQSLNNMPNTTKLIDGLENTLVGLNECKIKVQEMIGKWKEQTENFHIMMRQLDSCTRNQSKANSCQFQKK